MGFHPANFWLPRPIRCRVRSRLATHRQTDRQTDRHTDTGLHFIMTPPYGDRGHNNVVCCCRMSLQQSDGPKKELTLLDPKRSNAINIGLTILPPARTIRTAIFKMDSTIIGREQIEVRCIIVMWQTRLCYVIIVILIFYFFLEPALMDICPSCVQPPMAINIVD